MVAAWELSSPYLWIDGMASEIWDSPSLACLGPDLDTPPPNKAAEVCQGPGTMQWETLKNGLVSGWRTVGVHGSGSHGVRLFLQMVDQAMQESSMTVNDIRKLKLTLEHCDLIGKVPDVVEKLKTYGIILSCLPRRIENTPVYVKNLGPKVESFILPLKSWLDAGIKVVGQIDSGDPHAIGVFSYLWYAMSRKVGDRVVLPEERLDRVRVLKMWTRWAADYVYKPEELGSLEVGKLADFVVLDKDYFTIPEDSIPKIRPLLTAVGGKRIFLSREFANELGMEQVGYQPPPEWPLAPWEQRE